jgi:hypothetical protein
VFFSAYGVASFAMALADTFAPARVAQGTSWGLSPGWIREIACLDLFLCFMCVMALRERDGTAMRRAVASGLALVSILIGSNNFVAWIQSGRAAHLGGAALHAIAAVVAALTVRALPVG